MSTIFSPGYNQTAPRTLIAKKSVEVPAGSDIGRVNVRDIPLNDKYYDYLRADKSNIEGRMVFLFYRMVSQNVV
mgnify:CR=1 FL=1